MPEERDRDTLIDMAAPTSSGVSKIAAEMRPTVPVEAHMAALQSAGLSAGLLMPPGLGMGGSPLPSPGTAMALPGLGEVPGPAGMSEPWASAVMAQQRQIAQMQSAFEAMGGLAGGGSSQEELPIRELPAPRPAVYQCKFCHTEHDPAKPCAGMKLGLRLKSDHDKSQAKARKEAEAAAAAAATPP